MKANNEEITEIETDEWYLRRMNAGLAFLQDICYCLAWLIMEDDGVSHRANAITALLTVGCISQAQTHAKMLLDRRGRTFKDISAILKGQSRDKKFGPRCTYAECLLQNYEK